MIRWYLRTKERILEGCIEEAFFRSMLVVGIAGCSITLFFDVMITKTFSYIIPINLMFIMTLVMGLYLMNQIAFHRAAIFCLALLDIIITTRGLLFTEFRHISCTVLITIGFVCSMVTQDKYGSMLKFLLLMSLMLLFFKDYKTVPLLILIRHAIPYFFVYIIISISSGLLKNRFARNQRKMNELIHLLNQKNAQINAQHAKLQMNYRELSELNNNLGKIISQKTARIAEKNKQLADIAYENSHCIRAPLARMLGLLHLIQIDPDRKDFYVSKLNDQALEMDQKIFMVSKAIERNLYE
jgi:signal transduction histidine kinase